MRALKHLTDEDLMEIGNIYVNDLSYYYAGWDYPDSARAEAGAQARCEKASAPIDAELRRRGLQTTAKSLCFPLGSDYAVCAQHRFYREANP
jgi:hypothetical protein